MKKLLIFMPFFLLANQSIPMPPMPPALPVNNQKKIKHQKKKSSLPKECNIIPPMLIFMPPPLEADLAKCKNKLFLPKLSFAKKVFAKKHLKVKNISIVEGFIEVYKISTNKGDFYCNKDLSKCFKVVK